MYVPRILIADDHPLVIEKVTDLLKEHYLIVGQALDGRTMVEKAMELHPDVIVSDITMPYMSGISAASLLRANGCDAKFVFLTIHNEAEFVDACSQLGASRYVLKKHMQSDLIPAIEAAVAL
jgi:DNA-binding NarL/FixJ family response regulator